MSVPEHVRKMAGCGASVEETVAHALEEAERVNREIGCFTTICGEYALARARELDQKIKRGETSGRLLGVPVSVKDAICTKGIETTAGSAMLRGYKPPFSATAVQKIEAEGGIVIGKTIMDEFGFGGFCVNVGKGFSPPKNPLDKKRVTGGSSGGCGAATAALRVPHVSLAESTGGSITSPACFCGVAGITPTYGRVSRYGLIDYASSLDKIGSMGKTVADAALLLEVIQGHDPQDMTSRPEPGTHLSTDGSGTFRVGVPKELFEGVDERISDAVWKALKGLESSGSAYEEISLPSVKYAVPAYYLIAVCEASTNLAKLQGTRFGLQEPISGAFNEYFSRIRAAGFGDEAKRRIILGTFARMAGYRGQYYLKAMKVRTKIINEFKSSFKTFDALVSPSMPILPPTFEEAARLTPVEAYALDLCTTPPNVAGIPHVSVPTGNVDGLPAGIQVMADHLCEQKAVSVAVAFERLKL